jgi:hypothetical protein
VVCDEVANVMAPVCAVPPPSCWSERRPVFVTLPFAYVRPPENVVVAVQVGTPFTSASVWPFVPAEVVASAPVPLPRRSAFAWMFDHPVPPNAAESVEVAETTPFTAWRFPLSAPMVSDGVVSAPVEEIEVVPVPPNAAVFAEIAVVDAPPLNERSVEVALFGNRYAKFA